ncbi:MAG: hypothetical protein Q9182_006436 [Xanthomendoza sp. 2 TL-2023]
MDYLSEPDPASVSWVLSVRSQKINLERDTLKTSLELLGVDPTSSQKELDRQWRKTALRYHPDKVGNDPAAKEKFHLAQIAYDLLSDPTSKTLYDSTRSARLQKERQKELFAGKRKEIIHDLEERERGVKRARGEEEEEEQKLESLVRRLGEDGKRRRQETEEALRKDLERETTETHLHTDSPMPNRTSTVSELDRTVKVRWPLAESGASIKESDITALFSTFGEIESVTLLTPKELRLGRKKKKKQLAAICTIQYASIVGAHAAVEDFPGKTGPEWNRFDSVSWLANREPDSIINAAASSSAAPSPSTPAKQGPRHSPASFLEEQGGGPTTPTPLENQPDGHGPRKMPSFSSFSSAAFGTPKGSSSPFGKGLGASSPSLEELTMIRLKNAEKRRLVEALAREDEKAAAEVRGGQDDGSG